MTDRKPVFLLGDDHQIIRQGMALIVKDLFPAAEIKHASTLREILEKAGEGFLDAAILDAQFPDGNSVTILKKIRELQPDARIIIFSSAEEEHYSLKFIAEGANGFLSKLAEEAEIETALQELMTRGSYFSPITQQLLAQAALNPVGPDPLARLTDRELEVADLMAEGLGNLEIANKLDLRQNTVSTFKKRIFKKLDVETLVDFLEVMRIHREEPRR